MTWKQIETSREVRLWISQIVIPAIGVTMMVPEAREAIVEKFQEVKKSVKEKLHKS